MTVSCVLNVRLIGEKQTLFGKQSVSLINEKPTKQTNVIQLNLVFSDRFFFSLPLFVLCTEKIPKKNVEKNKLNFRKKKRCDTNEIVVQYNCVCMNGE